MTLMDNWCYHKLSNVKPPAKRRSAHSRKALMWLFLIQILLIYPAISLATTYNFGGGSGTNITAGAGDMSACTQTGNSLNCTVTKSSGNLFTSNTFGTALNLSAPPIIGGTTPAAITGSTVTSTGTLIAGTGPTTITNATGTLKATTLDNGAWAAPGAIGGTTPAAGTFTTLASTAGATTSAAFGTALNLTAPPAIGATTPAAATFTQVSNNCKGTVTLSTGSGTATNGCITATGVPYCVDTTAGNSITCAPASGTMAITGTGSDVIAWSMVSSS